MVRQKIRCSPCMQLLSSFFFPWPAILLALLSPSWSQLSWEEWDFWRGDPPTNPWHVVSWMQWPQWGTIDCHLEHALSFLCEHPNTNCIYVWVPQQKLLNHKVYINYMHMHGYLHLHRQFKSSKHNGGAVARSVKLVGRQAIICGTVLGLLYCWLRALYLCT